jgi:hypothetical protein
MKNKLLAGVILLVVTAAFLGSQTTNAQIFGNVRNEEGEYLQGVLVTITNLANNAEITTITGKKKGQFRILSLFPGLYQASFDMEGYQSYVVSRIQLISEQTANLKIKLKKKSEATVEAEEGSLP